MKLRLALVTVLVLAAISAATALAAERTGAVSAAAPTFAWDGGPGNGVGPDVPAGWGQLRCTPQAYECEDTQLDVKDAGKVTILIAAGAGSEDLDVAVYKMKDDGTADSGDDPSADSPIIE